MATTTKEFSEKVIELMKANKAPWQRPWSVGEAYCGAFRNLATKREYRGVNILALAMACAHHGWTSHEFLTFNQARKLKNSVLKGQHGTPVYFFNVTEKEVVKADGSIDKQDLFFLKTFVVFNAEQLANHTKKEKEVPSWEPLQIGEDILRNSAAVITYGGDAAYYNSRTDSIRLPNLYQFKADADYYATALHELAHWTGHVSRLNRLKYGKFGDEEYAREELRAEIASWMLAMATGLPFNPDNHAAYLNNWIAALEKDYKEITRACNDADKICQLLLSFVGMERKEEDKELEEATA